jgi:hypothetical protein
MMMQNNISFDSYYGRVLDPECYIFINMLNSILGTNEEINPGLKTSIMIEIKKFVKRLAPQNMNDYNQYVYYMFMYLLNKLKQINIPLKIIFEGNSHKLQLILKSYLVPLLDLMVEIKKIPEYHTFAYEYLLNNNIETNKSVFILENENEYNSRIINIPTINFKKYLTDNNISFNLSGALFYTHEHKFGILNNFLTDRLGLRKSYKTKRDTYTVGSSDYQFYDRRQLAMKINANSSYGLTGMSNFLFSNRQLAMSTTLSGRLCLKISQACGELYLKQLEEKYKEYA